MPFTTQPGCSARAMRAGSAPQCVASAPRATLNSAAFASLGMTLDNLAQSLPWNRSDSHAGAATDAGQTEGKTGTFFPARFCQRGNRHCGTLQGVGVRAKKIAGIKSINVYSLGLFVDPDAAKKSLKSYSSKPASKLVKDQGFYDALVKADDVEKTLHLNIAFGRITSSQFWDAIKGALAPPMKHRKAEADLQLFANTFDGVKFRKGLPISFMIAKGGELTSQIDGKHAGTIKSRALCQSLLGIYLGSSPVSPDAKESIGTGLAALVSHES